MNRIKTKRRPLWAALSFRKPTMTMTASQPKNKAQTKPVMPVLPPLTVEGYADAVQHVAMHCQEISYSISWLPTHRTASDSTKQVMVDQVHGKKKGFSISRQLFTSEHPLIAEMNLCRRRLTEWRDTFTIVKGAEVNEDANSKLRIESGVRLIRDEDIPEFEAGFRTRVDNLYVATALAQQYLNKPYDSPTKTYPSILDMDRERLGTDFNADDYPTNLADCVRVEMPQYNEYRVSVRLPKQIYERETERLSKALTGTIETATEYLCNTMTETFNTLAKQLVDKVRVKPRAPELARFLDAEVVKTEPQADGTVIYSLRFSRVEEGKKVSVTETLSPMLEAKFKEDYRPQQTGERKKITKSVIDSLMIKMENFTRVKAMLGQPGEKIDLTLDAVRTLLSRAGESSEQVVDAIKGGKFYRESLAETLSEVCSRLEETTVEVKQLKRKLNVNLLNKQKPEGDE